MGFVFVTCVITCSPAEHRFVRGEEPPVRPLAGLPDFHPAPANVRGRLVSSSYRSLRGKEAGTQLTHTSARPAEGVDG